MRSPFLSLPKGITFHEIKKCIPKKWIRDEQKVHGKSQSLYSSKTTVQGLEETDENSLKCLLTTLKDFAREGLLSKTFRTFSLIHFHTFECGPCDFVVDSISSILLSCTQFKLLSEGRQLHTHMITWGLEESSHLVPKLISFYASFNFLDEAHFITVASNLLQPLPWNVLISSYVRKGRFEDAIFAYQQMCHKRIKPDHYTLPSVLKACAAQSNLVLGKDIHRTIEGGFLEWDLCVQNALISMYEKCGDVETARLVFNKLLVKDEVSWNTMISGYASKGRWEEAFELFESMQGAGLELNIITWNTIAGGYLKTRNFKGALSLLGQMRKIVGRLDPVAIIIGLGACSNISSLKLGKEFHGIAVRFLCIDYVNVKNALITFYSRCEDLKHAYIAFRSVDDGSIITWNSMISGYACWDWSEEASFLFREMLLAGIEPNFVTVASMLPLCARVANLQHGKEFHCYVIKKVHFEGHLLIWNSLIDMYARSSKVSTARTIFNLLDRKDEVTYTSLIAGYGAQGEARVAVELFEEMVQYNIKPDHVAMVAVLSACSHSGLLAEGQLLFRKMQTLYGITPTLEHFACMVDLFGRAGLLNKAVNTVLRMPYEPTSEMWATLVGACRIHGHTVIGEWAAEKLLEMKPQNSGYYVLIANMYAATGCWEKLAKVRIFMRSLGVKKDPGCAWIDVGDGFSPFLVDDTSNDESAGLYILLDGLTEQMKGVGCEDGAFEEVILESLG